MRALLVEPSYRTKYPNLALMKISTKLKNEGYDVEYFKGMRHRSIEDSFNGGFDEIYITTLFTYDSEITVDTINYYHKSYSRSKIFVGGIFASLNAEYVEEKTGIKPFIGYSKELDMLKPDYDLIKTGTKWDDFSFVFTSRGCVNRCPYCAVPEIEPETWINPNWKDAIDLNKPNVMISDNNLTSQPIEHFKEVMDFLKEHKLKVIFDNGWDCRLFNENHLKHINGVKFLKGGLRFAFDNMSQEIHIQKTIQSCLDSGIKKDRLTIFILFNFNDTPKEAEYRARTIVNLDVRPYPQKYVPLNKLTRQPTYVGKYWTENLARIFRFFYLMQGYYRKQTFPEWINKMDYHPKESWPENKKQQYKNIVKAYEKYSWERK